MGRISKNRKTKSFILQPDFNIKKALKILPRVK
jgi:hypothetical protein